MNVDPLEIRKFSENAHRWWDPNSEFKPLHDLNPLRLDYIDRKASISGKRVLDIGCGGGILSEAMARRGAAVTGIDLNEKALKVARLHMLESQVKVDYQLSSAEAFSAQHPAEYDVITCLEMLEHVPDPASVVSAAALLVRPGGWLFFSTLNRNPKSYLLAVLGAEYVLGMLPRGTHDYAKFIKPSELARFCRAAGLEVDEVRGIHYHPLTQTFSLADSPDVNYLLACRA